jgi:hypothetical protein
MDFIEIARIEAAPVIPLDGGASHARYRPHAPAQARRLRHADLQPPQRLQAMAIPTGWDVARSPGGIFLKNTPSRILVLHNQHGRRYNYNL